MFYVGTVSVIRKTSINVEFNPQSFKSSSLGNTSPSFHVVRCQFYAFAIYVTILPCITRVACIGGSVLILTIASSSARDHLEYDEYQ